MSKKRKNQERIAVDDSEFDDIFASSGISIISGVKKIEKEKKDIMEEPLQKKKKSNNNNNNNNSNNNNRNTESQIKINPKGEFYCWNDKDNFTDKLITAYLFIEKNKEPSFVLWVNKMEDLNTISFVLKALSIPSFSFHNKMPQQQKVNAIERFKSHQESCSVLVSSSLLVNSLPNLQSYSHIFFDSILSDTTLKSLKNCLMLSLLPSNDSLKLSSIVKKFEVDHSIFERGKKRVNMATQLNEIKSTQLNSNSKDKWSKRLMEAADLGDDEDSQIAISEEGKKNILKAENLKTKIEVEVAISLFDSSSSIATISNKSMKIKMQLLGMISNKTGGMYERAAAETKWLDSALGSLYGGEGWKESIRIGAHGDAVSRAIRNNHVKWKKGGDDLYIASGWNPNPLPNDDIPWGGDFGKPCAHNEVVMNHLRPFAPLEVINTTVCSKLNPSGGNEGYDGCLEHLILSCRKKKKSITIWDTEAFHFISKKGIHSIIEKKSLLHWSKDLIEEIMKCLRHLTIYSVGRMSPKNLMSSIQFLSYISMAVVKNNGKKKKVIHGIGNLNKIVEDKNVWSNIIPFLLPTTIDKLENVYNLTPSKERVIHLL